MSKCETIVVSNYYLWNRFDGRTVNACVTCTEGRGATRILL